MDFQGKELQDIIPHGSGKGLRRLHAGSWTLARGALHCGQGELTARTPGGGGG